MSTGLVPILPLDKLLFIHLLGWWWYLPASGHQVAGEWQLIAAWLLISLIISPDPSDHLRSRSHATSSMKTSLALLPFQTLILLLLLLLITIIMKEQQLSYIRTYYGEFPGVQWLGLCAFTAEGPGSIPGRGTKILQATWCSQIKKNKIKKNLLCVKDHAQCFTHISHVIPITTLRGG